MHQVGYRTPIHLKASRTLRERTAEGTIELIHQSDQSALDALRQILDRQAQEPSYDEDPDLDDRGSNLSP